MDVIRENVGVGMEECLQREEEKKTVRKRSGSFIIKDVGGGYENSKKGRSNLDDINSIC